MIKKTKIFFKALNTYKILIIILTVILFYVGLRYILAPDASPEKLINDFMAGFFLSFGALMVKNIKSLKDTLKKYDPLAHKFPWYAEIYPFMFLFFGVALHTNSLSTPIAILTIALLGIQVFGMLKVLRSGKKVEDACIGSNFSAPLSYVTVVKNAVIIAMSIAVILINLI